MELIKYENGTALLDAEVSAKIAAFERQVKEINHQESKLKKAILEEMEAKNIIKLETEELAITYIAASYRETFDSKSLRKDQPDIYDEYVKISPVNSSVRVKVRDGA